MDRKLHGKLEEVRGMISFLILSLALAAVAITLCNSFLFRTPREWVDKRSKTGFLHALVSCPYCALHWLALVAMLIWNPKPSDLGPIVNGFALVGASAIFAGILDKLFKGEIE